MATSVLILSVFLVLSVQCLIFWFICRCWCSVHSMQISLFVLLVLSVISMLVCLSMLSTLFFGVVGAVFSLMVCLSVVLVWLVQCLVFCCLLVQCSCVYCLGYQCLLMQCFVHRCLSVHCLVYLFVGIIDAVLYVSDLLVLSMQILIVPILMPTYGYSYRI